MVAKMMGDRYAASKENEKEGETIQVDNDNQSDIINNKPGNKNVKKPKKVDFEENSNNNGEGNDISD